MHPDKLFCLLKSHINPFGFKEKDSFLSIPVLNYQILIASEAVIKDFGKYSFQ